MKQIRRSINVDYYIEDCDDQILKELGFEGDISASWFGYVDVEYKFEEDEYKEHSCF